MLKLSDLLKSKVNECNNAIIIDESISKSDYHIIIGGLSPRKDYHNELYNFVKIWCPNCGQDEIITRFYENKVTDCNGHEINPFMVSICEFCSKNITQTGYAQLLGFELMDEKEGIDLC